MTQVLVTQVRGKTGAPLSALLVERGAEVLGGTRDPEALRLAGVTPVRFAWDEPDTWAPALRDVDAVYLVRPDWENAPEIIEAFLAEAEPSTRVVFLSEQDADYTAPDGWSPRNEAAVRGSGRPWTILRPSWFSQSFTDPRLFAGAVLDDGELPFPAGDGRVAWIDARDIAAVAAVALTEDGHDGQTYEITGPEALTLPETAEVLSTLLGRQVVHRDLSIDEALGDSTGFARELDALTFERVTAGRFAPVTDTVERLTGRSSRSLRDLDLPH
ncbi:NAD(P)H-binding protein [Aeromicrobium sp. Leaf350]|uniref:NAD(P)H-binding protein n=1 Tax=Aeromicrobium sp. Leaf350 TaxID=2876565 RepID=UPI001E44FA29|nr:NAD(P)H-binding protein [Aeromicrobium sp. Leaf350]